MPRALPTQALLIHCGWCDQSLPTFRRQAWMDAVDHALDEHRAQLLATPEYARRFLRIVNPETGKRARIASPTSPQELAP
jgi:hypothetical protein